MSNWIEHILQRARNSLRQSQQYVSPISLAPPIPPRPFMYSSSSSTPPATTSATNYCNVINLMELPTSEYVYNPTTTTYHYIQASHTSQQHSHHRIPPTFSSSSRRTYLPPEPPPLASSTFIENKQYLTNNTPMSEVMMKSSPAYPLLRLQQTYCLDDPNDVIDCRNYSSQNISKTNSLSSKNNQQITVITYEEDILATWCGQSQVIAFICGLIVIILMIMGLVSTDWLMAAGWRQGLFMHCIEEDAPTPLPFNMQEPPGCYQSRDAAYVKAAAALCVITLLTDVVATVLTGLGIRTKDHRTKYKYYRFAVLVMLLALISILIALVIYPVCFAAELNLGNRTVWEFGWAYGVGWGAAIFLFGGVILLLCDKESEEIYYKERKIVHDNDSRA